MKDEELDRESVQRVANAALQRMKTAGEVRFIKDRGGDTKEWAWGAPPPTNRELDPDYKFEVRNLEPLARTLRSTLMALGHVQSAYNTFTKIKSRNVSPDGSLGGRGYIQKITDIRRQFMNCSEVLSAVSDTLYDEIQAPHWHPDMGEDASDPREREEVMDIMTDVQEIKENPEQWAEGEESEMDEENGGGGNTGPQPEMGRRASQAMRLAKLYLAGRGT